MKEYIAHFREKDGKKQFLSEHLLQVSAKASEFAFKIGLNKAGELIGLLHDLGKYSREFQNYIQSATGLINYDEDDYVDAKGKKGKIDHSSAGAQVIFEYYNKSLPELLIGQILSLCICSHHSGLVDCIEPDGNDNFKRKMNKEDGKTHKNEALNNLEKPLKDKYDTLISEGNIVGELKAFLKQFTDLQDLLETRNFKIGLVVRFLYSCLIDADRLDTADFESPLGVLLRNNSNYPDWKLLIDKFNCKLFDFEKKNDKNNVDLLRKEISDQCYNLADNPKAIYQLTVPTGGGKTLSSLRFALHHAKKHSLERIIYVIPFTSIIDQNAEETRKILEEKDSTGNYLNQIVLEHHSNLTPDEENWKQKILSENWDAPVVFTTNVQFLEALFGYGTRSARRMHQLANSLIIFDEIQMLPIRCVHMFNVALRFLVNNCGSSVILSTATQPLLDKIEPKNFAIPILPDYQIIKNVNRLYDSLKRVEILDVTKIGGWTVPEVAKLTIEELMDTGSVLIVVNTKKSAENLFRQILLERKNKIFHLSTNMCPRHRMLILKVIKRCLKRRERVICVSTQLIEAGIDISFGSVIRYIAGLDSIAQAAGRCNREGRLKDDFGNLRFGKVFIVNPAEENLDKLPDIKVGKSVTERVLNEYKNNPEEFSENIIGLRAMELFYQYYFYTRKDEMNYPVKLESGAEDNLFNLLSVNYQSVEEYKRKNQGDPPNIPLRQAFMSASKEFHPIDSYTKGIIVPFGKRGKQLIVHLCASKDIVKEYQLLKEAQRYSVNVFSYVFERLVKLAAIRETQKGSGIYFLDSSLYSNQFGLSEEPVTTMEFYNV